MDDLPAGIHSAECGGEVDEFTAIAEKCGYWSDGAGEFLRFYMARLRLIEPQARGTLNVDRVLA